MPGAVGRNDACPCGSGKKYKRCCESKRGSSRGSRLMMGLVLAIIAGGLGAALLSLRHDSAPAAAPGRVWSPEHAHYH
ncbi:MAG: SEC-C metal-binding domain-containing protein [Acidobacteriota bacterium]